MTLMGNAPADAWFTRERMLLFALVLATLLGIFVCCLIVQPFVPAIAIAIAAVFLLGWYFVPGDLPFTPPVPR